MSTSKDGRQLVWQQVHWPGSVDFPAALGLLRRLASDSVRRPVIWEARATNGVVTHLVGTAAHQVGAVSRALAAHVPGTITAPGGDERPPVGRSARLRIHGEQFHLAGGPAPQAARAILGALTEARFREEHAVIQIVLARGRHPQLLPGKPADPTQSWFDALARGVRPASGELAARMRDKSSEPGFEAVVRVAAEAKSDARRLAILQGLFAAIRTLQTGGVRMEFMKELPGTLDRAQAPLLPHLTLAATEVVSLSGWPIEDEQLPGMPSPHPKVLRLTAKDAETERVFAMTNAPATPRPIGLSVEDARFHTVFLGPTGSGKSTAMLSRAVADLKDGLGLVSIDPKGDTTAALLDRIPESRLDDVVLLDPTDEHRPVGLNPLHAPGTRPELIADGVVSIFRSLAPDAFGPRVHEMVHGSLLSLASYPGATLTWLPRLLSDATFRAGIIGTITDPLLLAFWADFNDMSPRQQQQFAGPVLSRLRQFVLRPSLRGVLDQSEPKFHLEDVFTKKKILLVSLNTGILGNEAARLLGSLIVTQLWQLTLSRASIPEQKREPVAIYIDELQEFIHLSGNDLSDALARSRSLNVGWSLAHQFRDQLPTDARNALDANALNKVIFGVGPKDARELATMAPELTAEDFMTLPQYGIYASLMRHGKHLGWVSGITTPAPPVTSDHRQIIATSRKTYGRDHQAPTDWFALPGTSKRTDSPIGRRRRDAS